MRNDLYILAKEVSMREFGFFSSHPPRKYEYSWILEQMENRTPGKVIDIGAGISPVPVILRDWGYEVTTIDLGDSGGKEWGCYQYVGITSVNADFADYQGDSKDYIISISAIEHMTKETRLKVWDNIYKHLKIGGELICTIDTRKGGIWNKNQGKKIENNHGTIDDLKSELSMFKDVKFELLTLGHIDPLFITARK